MSRPMTRHDSRSPEELRKIEIQSGIAPHAQGSVLIAFGKTRVICTAMIEESVFSAAQLEAMVAAAGSGIAKLLEIQNTALSLP